MRLLGTLLFTCLSFVVPVSAGIVLFDFEDRANTWNPGDLTGALTSYTYAKDGLTMTVVRDLGATFDISANTTELEYQIKPAAWGLRSLDPFSSTCDCGFLLNFSNPLRSFSVDLGDYGGDLDELQVIGYSGWNATGTAIGSTSGQLIPNFSEEFPWQTLTLPDINDVNGPFYRSVYIKGGPIDGFTSQIGSHSVYLDNINVHWVPEPGSIVLAGGGVVSLLLLRRRRA